MWKETPQNSWSTSHGLLPMTVSSETIVSYRRVKQRMPMTVSSETMHENHNRDAAYDSVDIPLSLSSVDMAAANTEKNWSQPILEEDPHFSDLHIFHAHVVPRKKDVHLQAQDLQVHIYTHTNAWHLFTPWMITDAHNTYAVTESEKTHVADWTCSYTQPVHFENLFIYPMKHIQKGQKWPVEPVHFTPFTHIQKSMFRHVGQNKRLQNNSMIILTQEEL